MPCLSWGEKSVWSRGRLPLATLLLELGLGSTYVGHDDFTNGRIGGSWSGGARDSLIPLDPAWAITENGDNLSFLRS